MPKLSIILATTCKPKNDPIYQRFTQKTTLCWLQCASSFSWFVSNISHTIFQCARCASSPAPWLCVFFIRLLGEDKFVDIQSLYEFTRMYRMEHISMKDARVGNTAVFVTLSPLAHTTAGCVYVREFAIIITPSPRLGPERESIRK